MRSPLLSMGFRPFYVGAAIFAALAVPAWYGAYAGFLPLHGPLPGLAWHAHEMVFGFAPAVIGGFLLTAVRAWTGHLTLEGTALAGLVILWIAGRLLLLTGPDTLAVVVDLTFLPLLTAALAAPLWRSSNWRNAFVVPLLLVLWALSATHHGAYRGWVDPVWAMRSHTAALDLVALLLAVIGGRIIPNFSANAVAGLNPRRWPVVEALAIGSLALLILLEITGLAERLPMWGMRALFGGAGAIHLIRLLGWKPWAIRGNVLLVVLPLGYLWLPVHLALRAVFDFMPGTMSPLALHALSTGAMAGLMLAMMTRSALGHTGRPLTAGRGETFMFVSIHLAALARVAGPLVWPAAYVSWLGLSALLWMLAFGAFAVVYAPIVARPRLDQPAA